MAFHGYNAPGISGAVTISQASPAFDDLDSFEKHLSDIL